MEEKELVISHNPTVRRVEVNMETVGWTLTIASKICRLVHM